MIKSISVLLMAVGAMSLVACGSGGSSDVAVSTATSPVTSTILGAPVDTEIAVDSLSVSLDSASGEAKRYAQDFTLRSLTRYDNGTNIRRIRYGKPRDNYSPKRNYAIPLTFTTAGAVEIGSGSGTFTGDDVESGVTSRTIALRDVALPDAVFGVFSTSDTGTAPRPDFFEIHAYAAGNAATALPNTATYSGQFLANVISESGGPVATEISLPANVAVNFLGNMVNGTVGDASNPDLTLNGALTGTTMSGTATVTSGNVALTNGSSGSFTGGVYGAGARDIAGTVHVRDAAGGDVRQMIGAFGGTQN